MTKRKHSLKLIEGEFTPAQTRSVLQNLISNKINFHTLEAFSIKERSNGDITYSQGRVAELKEASTRVNEIVDYCTAKDYQLKIESTVIIKFIRKSKPVNEVITDNKQHV